ncbi:MAG: phenylacetate--CoA ligase family protein [Oscillospiraceae bacterium]|nr:phenylacetate--CoA ligase family protein [Oscillospiraceae bacterium]
MKTIEPAEAAKLVKDGFLATHAQRLEMQKKRLAELVEYARENSPYLKKLYKELPDNFVLTDIPIMEKYDMIEHYDDWVTDRDIHLPDIEAFCNRESSDGELYLGKYTVLHTSGTTGSPLYMARDRHRNLIHGQLIAQRLMNGIAPDIMDHTKHHIAAVIYAVHGASSYEGLLRQKYSVPGFEDNMRAVSVLGSIDEIVAELNEFKPDTMSGYGSILTMLALEKKAGRLDISPQAIFNSAEALSPDNHRLVEEAFGCPVKNNYCMTEGGEIAMTVDSPDMLLNEDWIIVEPVDEDRNPVTDPHKWSGGILVTDLANFVQPIIRYYVSDCVRIEQISDDNIRLPKFEIRGRVNDVFIIDGKTFSTAGIGNKSEFWSEIVNLQIVQIADDELQLRFVWHTGADREKAAQYCDEAAAYFVEHGCPKAKVSYSNEPPIKSQRGGKTPRYIDLRK